MAKYQCPICNHINELELNGDNKYRCEKCTRVVRAIKARRTKAEIEAEKAKEEAIKMREELADLNKDEKIDNKDVEIVKKAAKKNKKGKFGRKKNEEEK